MNTFMYRHKCTSCVCKVYLMTSIIGLFISFLSCLFFNHFPNIKGECICGRTPCCVRNIYIYIYIYPNPPHVLVDFVVFPPGHGRSVTDFWGWDAHKAWLRFPDDVSGDVGGCHGRTENRTRNLMISRQRLWPLDHDAGLSVTYSTPHYYVEPFIAKGQRTVVVLFYN